MSVIFRLSFRPVATTTPRGLPARGPRSAPGSDTARCRLVFDFLCKATLDLPDGNRTTDRTINELSIKEQYIIVTKDSDFVESFLLRREPWKLLLISTGNIGNNELEKLLSSSIQKVIEAFDGFDFIELSRTSMIFHL